VRAGDFNSFVKEKPKCVALLTLKKIDKIADRATHEQEKHSVGEFLTEQTAVAQWSIAGTGENCICAAFGKSR
jgi:hypothetical protein